MKQRKIEERRKPHAGEGIEIRGKRGERQGREAEKGSEREGKSEGKGEGGERAHRHLSRPIGP